MTDGLERTLKLLAKTPNEAATDLLLAQLESQDLRTLALRTLVERRSVAGRRALIARWNTFSDRSKSIIADKGSRLTSAVRDAVLSQDPELAENGFDAVLWIREYDLIPALITALEDHSNELAPQAAQTLLSLADMLYEDYARPRDYKDRRDPELIRAYVISSLEKSVQRFEQHKRLEVIEAFLMLARRENPALRRILQNPHGSAYLPTLQLMTQSPRPGVQLLLLSHLQEPYCPSTIHKVLSRRIDFPFLRRFLQGVDLDNKALRSNLKRINAFKWLDDLDALRALHQDEQQQLVRLLMASGVSRLKAFDLLAWILDHGCVEGRREASRALEDFRGADANQYALNCLSDTDPEVQANAVSHLRERGMPGTMQRLLELTDSPHEVVRQAVEATLQEYSFERFLGNFDLLDEESARTSGQLVRRIDSQVGAQLAAELEATSRSRRQRALAMAEVMGAVSLVEPSIIALLEGDDHVLRAEAARTLSHSFSTESRNALRGLLLDKNPAVQEAAQDALQSMTLVPGSDGSPAESTV